MFECYTIDTLGIRWGQTGLADMDRDGDLDWIAGRQFAAGGELFWWEYEAPDRWKRHEMGKGRTDVGGSALDVNGDGWIDMLSGSVLLLNPGNPRESGFIGTDVGTISSHDTGFGDINGDGKPDVVANSDQAGLFWYEIPEDLHGPWQPRLIASSEVHKVHGGASPLPVGDIDGDGDNDVVTGQGWYENADGKGNGWVPHLNIDFGEHHRYGLAVKTWVGDMDGDGDADVVQAEADNPDSRVALFENDGSGDWTRHMIKNRGDGQDFHSLVVADFDLDGDPDVFSGGGPLSTLPHRCYIWENRASRGRCPDTEDWVEHVLLEAPCHEAVGGDVDGDGDTDICSKPWTTGNRHFYLRNMLAETAGK